VIAISLLLLAQFAHITIYVLIVCETIRSLDTKSFILLKRMSFSCDDSKSEVVSSAVLQLFPSGSIRQTVKPRLRRIQRCKTKQDNAEDLVACTTTDIPKTTQHAWRRAAPRGTGFDVNAALSDVYDTWKLHNLASYSDILCCLQYHVDSANKQLILTYLLASVGQGWFTSYRCTGWAKNGSTDSWP